MVYAILCTRVATQSRVERCFLYANCIESEGHLAENRVRSKCSSVLSKEQVDAMGRNFEDPFFGIGFMALHRQLSAILLDERHWLYRLQSTGARMSEQERRKLE